MRNKIEEQLIVFNLLDADRASEFADKIMQLFNEAIGEELKKLPRFTWVTNGENISGREYVELSQAISDIKKNLE